MIHIDLIPHAVKEIAEKVANVTKQIETKLQSAEVSDFASLFPGIADIDKALIEECETTIKACKAIGVAMDGIDITHIEHALLQGLGSRLSKILHGGEHSTSNHIIWFEVVFNHLFGKK